MTTRIDPDDPKWTAYILGELNPAEHDAIETQLNASEEARGLVEELRVAASMMKADLRTSISAAALTDQQRNAIISAATVSRPRRWSAKGPWIWIGGFATASCAALILLVATRHEPPVQQPPAEAANSLAPNTTQALDSEKPSSAANAPLKIPAEQASRPAAATPVKKKINQDEPQSAVAGAVSNDRLDKAETAKEQATLPVGTVAAGALNFQAEAQDQKTEQQKGQQDPAAYDTTAFAVARGGAARSVALSGAPAAPAAAKAPALAKDIGMTASSYTNVRGYIDRNTLPPRTVVRTADMVNYFAYEYPQPKGTTPINAVIEAAPAPWNPQHRLVRIGIQARGPATAGGATGVVARNAIVQLQFNTAVVEDYRIIGDDDGSKNLNNIRMGQSVTILCEVVPAAKAIDAGSLMLTIAYQEPSGTQARSLVFPFIDHGQSFAAASNDFRFAAAVASFGMILTDSPYKGTATINSLRPIVESSVGRDRDGMRREFLQLVRRAAQLRQP